MKRERRISGAGLGLVLLFGCRSGVLEIGRRAVLPDFTPVPGRHCESSAICNMLRYEGYPLSEVQIIGAGAAPGFIFARGRFPFLGGRNLEMKELAFAHLGIAYTEVIPREGESRWKEICGLLEAGHPVVLRVDMRYLPYLYGGKYGPKRMSFGWHMICLVGIDGPAGTAYVTDTGYSEVQRISLKALHKARFSATKTMPPRGIYYYVEKAPGDFELDWGSTAASSLAAFARGMSAAQSHEDALAGLAGLQEFPGALARLDEQVPSYLLKPVLEFLYGCIETNGTGGAAFRTMYGEFLRETAAETGDPVLRRAAEELGRAEALWHTLASQLLSLTRDTAALRDGEQRRSRLEGLSSTAEELFRAERGLCRFIDEESGSFGKSNSV